MTKRVRPGWLVKSTLPPCAAVTASTMARPRPVLPAARDREVSALTNRSNRVDWRSGAMPGPSSVTLSSTAPGFPGARASATVTVVPCGVCLAALLIRLAST